MKNLLKNHSLWLTMLPLQLLLSFGLYMIWQSENTLQNDPRSAVFEENVQKKADQVSDSVARTVIELQRTTIDHHQRKRAETNQVILYMLFVSLAVLFLLSIGLISSIRNAKDKPRESG